MGAIQQPVFGAPSAPAILGFWEAAPVDTYASRQPVWIAESSSSIVVGEVNRTKKSTDGGVTWTNSALASISGPEPRVFYAIQGGGRYAGPMEISSGGFSGLSYSADGLDWTNTFAPTEVPGDQIARAMVYAFGYFYVFGRGTATYYRTTAQLEDPGTGIFAVQFQYGTTAGIYSAETGQAFGNSTIVTIGNGRSGDTGVYAQRSTDGVTFQAATTVPAFPVRALAFGGGKFLCLEVHNGTPKNRFSYSTDGDTWTTGTFPQSRTWNALLYAEGRWIACCSGGADFENKIATSSDGITWTVAPLAKQFTDTLGAEKIVFSSGRYFAFRRALTVGGVEQHQISLVGATLP